MTAPARVEVPPSPGSAKAIAAGCKCPVGDNGRGRGAYIDADGEPVFWYSHGCRVHFPDPVSPTPRERNEEGR